MAKLLIHVQDQVHWQAAVSCIAASLAVLLLHCKENQIATFSIACPADSEVRVALKRICAKEKYGLEIP
jgi:hypothetical protein